jgi:ABC-type branched-subunit amino acid transport system ATPase component
VYAALRELRAAGTAILLVEEKAHDVVALADRIVFMAAGRVSWERPTDQVDSDLLVQSYLGISDVPADPAERPGAASAMPQAATPLA